jgi:hypothetical protein
MMATTKNVTAQFNMIEASWGSPEQPTCQQEIASAERSTVRQGREMPCGCRMEPDRNNRRPARPRVARSRSAGRSNGWPELVEAERETAIAATRVGKPVMAIARSAVRGPRAPPINA